MLGRDRVRRLLRGFWWVAGIVFCLALTVGAEAESGEHQALQNKAGGAPADDIQAHGSCPFCGMDRGKFAHSRVLLQYDDGTVQATCSIHCAARDMASHMDKYLKGFWVGDYRTRNLIDAEKAVWVLGGNKTGVMTKRAKWAFGSKEDAEQFIALDGGKICIFEDALRASYDDMYEDIKMIRDRRKAKRMQKAH